MPRKQVFIIVHVGLKSFIVILVPWVSFFCVYSRDERMNEGKIIFWCVNVPE